MPAKRECGAHTGRGKEESASPHSWRGKSRPLGKTAGRARGLPAHRTLLGAWFSEGIPGRQSWVCLHLNTRAHTQCRRTRPCMHMNQEHKHRPSPKRPTWGRSPCRRHLLPLGSLARHPRGQKETREEHRRPAFQLWVHPPQLSPITPPGSQPQFISPKRGLQGHLREMASLSILGLRPSLLCVHSLRAGGPGSQRPGAWSHAARPARMEFSLPVKFPPPA